MITGLSLKVSEGSARGNCDPPDKVEQTHFAIKLANLTRKLYQNT